MDCTATIVTIRTAYFEFLFIIIAASSRKSVRIVEFVTIFILIFSHFQL